jgi:hypothetical protein
LLTGRDVDATGPKNISEGSGIVAVNDQVGTDHIFYEDASRNVVRALYSGQQISDFVDIATVGSSQFAASYNFSGIDTGALFLYQESNGSAFLGFQKIDRSGQLLSSGSW